MDIKNTILNYLSNNFLDKNSEYQITYDTPLISGGLVDSISTLQLVDFIEGEFNVEFQAHEVDRDNLDSISLIEQFVLRKLKV